MKYLLYPISGEGINMLYTVMSRGEPMDMSQVDEADDNDLHDMIALMKNLQADTAGILDQLNRIKGRYNAVRANYEQIKDVIHRIILSLDAQEYRDDEHRVWVHTNPVSVDITDESLVPSEYQKPQPNKIDKDSIRRHFVETGEEVPGTEAITDKTHLRIM